MLNIDLKLLYKEECQRFGHFWLTVYSFEKKLHRHSLRFHNLKKRKAKRLSSPMSKVSHSPAKKRLSSPHPLFEKSDSPFCRLLHCCYSRVQNKHNPTFIIFWKFFQGLQSYYGLKRLKGVSSKPSGKVILGPDFCFSS